MAHHYGGYGFFVLAMVSCMFYTTLVISAPDTSFVFGACNENSYTSGDSTSYSVSYVVSDLETVTANHPGFDYYTQSPWPQSIIYGHARCAESLDFSDCVTCISTVKSQLLDACPNRVGAQLILRECRMRYEEYPFVDN